MTRYLLLLCFLLSGSAVAQEPIDPARYFPLGPADRWVYAYERIVHPTAGEPGDTLLRYAEQTVVGDTTIAGEAWTLVRIRQYERNGALLEEGVVPVRVADEPPATAHTLAHYPEIIEEPVSGAGIAAFWVQLLDYTTGPTTVHVGSLPYTVDGAYGRADGCFSDGFGEIVCGCNQHIVAADVGLLSYECTSYATQMPYIVEATELVYAEVGGAVYGLNPVASEQPVPASAALAVAPAFPNPFRDAVMLVVALPTPSPLYITVFDVLGRRVHAAELGIRPAGISSTRLDGAGWTPGVYLVRVEAAGQAATQQVVRVR